VKGLLAGRKPDRTGEAVRRQARPRFSFHALPPLPHPSFYRNMAIIIIQKNNEEWTGCSKDIIIMRVSRVAHIQGI
jgi:hypothetical protein